MNINVCWTTSDLIIASKAVIDPWSFFYYYLSVNFTIIEKVNKQLLW